MFTPLHQFKLICWKNLILLRKRVVLTVIQLFLPVIFIVLLFIIRQSIAPEKHREQYHDEISFGYEKLFYGGSQLYKDWGIGYTPRTPFTSFVIDHLRNKMQENGNTKIKLYSSVQNYSLFEDLYKRNSTVYLGTFVFISFDRVIPLWGGLDVQYSLRFPAEQHWKGGDRSDWLTERWYPREIREDPRSKNRLGHITTPGYYREGFVLLQTILDDAIILWQYDRQAQSLPDTPVKLSNFPYPSFTLDDYSVIIKLYMPLFIMLCFVVNATLVAVDVTLEKERKLKESMRLMGLKVWVNWLAWFLNHLLQMLISVLLMTFLFHLSTKQSSVFRLSDPSITFVFLFLFSISVIMFAFLMSSIFAKANSAAAATAIIYFLSYVPYYYIQIYYNGVTFGAKIALCFFNNIAMSFGCMQISKLETLGLGLQWDNLTDTYLAQDDMTMGLVMVMLVVDILLYALLTAYFDSLFPGEFGVPLPFYFPFTYWYWFGHKTEPFQSDGSEGNQDNDKFEKAEKKKRVGVRIRGLSKYYSKDASAAVDNLSLDVYEGFITAFLGHNGAGKTTTMFMLTGFIKPSKGTVFINGHDISRHMDKVRSSLGLCPQHNILFRQLTVHQHLVFFAMLKGCSSRDAEEETERMMVQVGLEAKRDAESRALSGGMKRKLSIAIALIGGSKFVILDEPTSGMDPESRRQTWDLLQRVRGGRSIIISTHFMDEADYLSDRIGIMSYGKLQCYGTPMFLKNKYGIGYHLTITKTPQCNLENLTDVITNHVTNAKFESELGTELTYLLPKEESKKIAKLFKVIEAEQEDLGIQSFGVSVTTMEEVFIKVCEAHEGGEEKEEEEEEEKEEEEEEEGEKREDEEEKKTNDLEKISNLAWLKDSVSLDIGRSKLPFQLATAEEFKDDLSERGKSHKDMNKTAADMQRYEEFFSRDFSRQTFIKRKTAQFVSLFCKRGLNTLRDWKMTLFQLLLPLIFTILACIAIYNMESKGNSPPLIIDFPPNIIPHWNEKYITPVLIDYGPNTSPATSAWEACVHEVLSDDTELVLLRREGEVFRNVYKLSEESIPSNHSMQHYLMAQAKKNLFKYKRNYLFALEVSVSSNHIKGFFQDEAYHAMPLVMNKINNIRLCKYLSSRTTPFNPLIAPLSSSPPQSSISSFPIIRTNNFPLPRHPNKTLLGISKFDNITLSAGIISNSVAFGVSLMVGTFVIFLIAERHCGSKHSQLLSGADPVTFWLTSFLWDAINYLLPVVNVVVVLVVFQTEGYYENISHVIFLLLCYFWAMSWLVYCVSLLPVEPSNGYIIVTVANVFTGTVTNLLITILKYPLFGIAHVAYKLEWLFYALFPNFSLSKGLLDIYFNYQGLKICKAIEDGYLGRSLKEICQLLRTQNETFPCCLDNCGDLCLHYNEDYLAWSMPGVGRSVAFMLIQGVLALLVLFLYEFLRKKIILAFKRRKHYRPQTLSQAGVADNNEISVRTNFTILSDNTHNNSNNNNNNDNFDSSGGDVMDSDVLEEAEKTMALNEEEMKNRALVLKKVSKFYGRLLAVDDLCLSINKGECFGLLGVNGAGKTTTFKMLVGEEVMEEGMVFINGEDWRKHTSSIGYCPQFDALVNQMTVNETLLFYAAIRGIKCSELKKVVADLIDIFLLNDHANKKAGNLSGGNKRKLGVAISLVGNPPIVFLDEPTTGMDPAARRKLWNVITAVRETGKTIVLTSHSMEECEALCTRLAIMVNGRFQCLGSTQHLKSKFGSGFTVVVKMRSSKKADVTKYYMKCLCSFINKMFPGNVIKDRHEGLLHYHIPQPLNSSSSSSSSSPLTWSILFQALEKAREPFMLEDYSVAQTTLEELFVNLAKKQH